MTSDEVTHGGRSSPAASSCRARPGPSTPPQSPPSPPLPTVASVAAAAASAAALGKRSWYLFSSVDNLRTCWNVLYRETMVAWGDRGGGGRGSGRKASQGMLMRW